LPGLEGECAECLAEPLGVQQQATSLVKHGALPVVQGALDLPGQPLDTQTRSFMESRFGHTFSQVRVYVADRVAQSARLEKGVLVHNRMPSLSVGPVILQRQDAAPDAGPHQTEASVGEDAGSSAGDAGPGAATPEGAPAGQPCSPTGLSRADYLTQPGTSTDDFGLTVLAGQVTIPVVHTTRGRGGLRVDETAAAMPPITSVFTAEGTFDEGTVIFASQDGVCRSGRYPIRWTIFPDGARRIRAAEMEHCADFQYAFDISLRRYADAVNQVARSSRTFQSQRAAEAYITRLVGAAPADWSSVFNCLAQKTTMRDGARGTRGWHTPRPYTTEPSERTNCAFAGKQVSGISLPEVDRHPPSEIIRDCGEYGLVRDPQHGGATPGR
jgi:hypothetical protein